MKKSEIKNITKLADYEAEIIELSNIIAENGNSEKVSLWKKELKSLKLKYTKLKNKLDKSEVYEEPINVNLILQNNISLDNILAIKKYIENTGECVVEFISPISDGFISLMIESMSEQVRIERLDENTVRCFV